MRHGKKFNHLSRTKSHRKAMLSNMACSLIEHKRINTTVAKAKALRGFVEPLISKSKNDTTHSRRVVFSYLNNKEAVTELFREVAPKVGERPGGYTRIIKTGNRQGDNAELCMMELVDFNELYVTETKKPTKKRRRRRGGGKGSSEANESKETAATKETDSSKEEKTSEKKEAKAESKSDSAEGAKAEKKTTDVDAKKAEPNAEKEPKKEESKEDKKEDKKS